MGFLVIATTKEDEKGVEQESGGYTQRLYTLYSKACLLSLTKRNN